MKGNIRCAWEMEWVVKWAVDISVDDKDHYKCRITTEEGGNKEASALEGVPRVMDDVAPLDDLPP